jgi:hypothetical protein
MISLAFEVMYGKWVRHLGSEALGADESTFSAQARSFILLASLAVWLALGLCC